MKLYWIILIAGLIALGATEYLQNFTNDKAVINGNAKALGYQKLSSRGDTDSDPDDDSDDSDDSDSDDEDEDDDNDDGYTNPATDKGYKEDVSDPDGECEIGALQPMLDELKLSKDPQGRMPPRKKQYYTANGRRYRVTTAYATIIINPQAGLIYFLRRGSAVKEARDLWRIRKGDPVPSDELPALRASSDLAWGFWNRVRRDKLAEIHGFVSMLITNGETRRIIDRILREQELDRVPLWPGIDVKINTPQYMALLGSPNGRAVGYFLAQHKAQIGGNRCVKTIRIFRGDAMTEMPNLLFAVEWAPSPPANAPTDPVEEWLPYPDDGMGALTDIQVGNVVKRSDDGRNMVRSHKVWVKL
ncbi:hypothetical protein J4E82_008646 [Alternaria postmessia]|uniref:uncharacterized protein n=1 Tax=Alternaria postmessia TaxID=1187938 RepID=UPI00222439F3|nr:uncharacterized protein J4E82_008646 [Alternaria postmessia]KAI5372642.1 hypothetical protein J4E82_008646 [Alternaria postmessia]